MPYKSTKSSFEIYREGGTLASIRMLVTMVLVVRGFRSRMDEMLRPIGHNSSRMETLGAIANMPDPKSQSDIAKRLRVESGTVTRMVDALSEEGLVSRAPDPNDRRINRIEITEAGERELENIFRVYDRVREHILQDVPEEEYDRLYDMFQQMLTRLHEPINSAIEIPEMPKYDRLKR